MDKLQVTVSHDWKNELHRNLRDDFIHYQYNLDHPHDSHLKTLEEKHHYIYNNWLARNKVESMVCQVMQRIYDEIG